MSFFYDDNHVHFPSYTTENARVTTYGMSFNWGESTSF